MAKIKEIHQIVPQPIKGFWWFEITLDTGVTAKYKDEREVPFKVGDDMPYCEVRSEQGKSGLQPVFHIVQPPSNQPPSGLSKDDVIRKAKITACIEVMGYSTLPDHSDYPEMLKKVFEQLDKL